MKKLGLAVLVHIIIMIVFVVGVLNGSTAILLASYFAAWGTWGMIFWFAHAAFNGDQRVRVISAEDEALLRRVREQRRSDSAFRTNGNKQRQQPEPQEQV